MYVDICYENMNHIMWFAINIDFGLLKQIVCNGFPFETSAHEDTIIIIIYIGT